MKNRFTLLCLVSSLFSVAQIPITAVTTSNVATPSPTTYTDGVSTYNWGVSPNNSTQLVTGFTAGGLGYGFTTGLTGVVKLRRVNNAFATGNFTLIWAEYVLGTNVFNMFPQYQNDMEPFFNNHIYNKGSDNFFDNTSANSNNIERLDWILPGAGYSTPNPGKIGFAVFDRGGTGAHDPFCIAAITSVDGSGNPATYGTIVRVATANFGDPAASSVTYRILKAAVGSDLLDAGSATQNRGGVYISLQTLGIGANVPVYGYSLFSNDLPVGAAPVNLVDYTNATYFPTNSGTAEGGIDLIAVTGAFTDLTILPTRFTSFSAVENNSIITLKWKVENESSVDRYRIERSTDGGHYFTVSEVRAAGAAAYSIDDHVMALAPGPLYYRIKQYDHNGAFYFSSVLAVSRPNQSSGMVIYPNPATDYLFITMAATTNEKAVLAVTNSAGAQVIRQPVQLAKGNNYYTLNGVDRLSAGRYQLTLTSESGKPITKNFIKQ